MNTFRNLFLSFTILIVSSLSATNIISRTFNDTSSGWNSDALAKIYFHHSETQRQWAWEFLSKINLSPSYKILDFGCRDGKISAGMARLVPNGSVLGLDISQSMIQLANVHFPPASFPNLQFKISESLTLDDFPGNHEYDLITAFAVFHLIPDPLEVLINLKMHLKPSGKLLIVTPTGKNQALYLAANEIFPKYGLETPWNNGSSTGAPRMRTLDGCDSLLRKAGYTIDSLEIIDNDNPFYDIEDFIGYLVGTASATWQIPLSISQSFFTDLANRMIELDPTIVDEKGHIHFEMPRIHVVASLPGRHEDSVLMKFFRPRL